MACVSILSEDVAKLPCHVYRKLDNGGKEIVADHPLERLLQKPNDYQDRFEFVEQMQAALLLRGNAYAPVIRNNRGVPIAMIPVNPDRVTLYEAGGGALFYQVARGTPHEIAALASLPLMIPASDMFHIRWLSLNGLWGVSRIGMAREAIGLSLSQQEQAARFAKNGAHLGGVLQTDKKLSEVDAKRLRNDWKSLKTGQANAGETAILEQGLKWSPLGLTSVDAEFLASRKFQVEEIGRLFRMPGHKLGILDKSTNATMEQADQDYANNTLTSYLERWEAKISDYFGLEAEGLFAEFDMSRFLRASMLTRMSAYRVAIMSGVMTPNQASRAEGLPDDPAGDVRLQPANMIPLGTISVQSPGPGSDTTGRPADGGDGDIGAPDELKAVDARFDIREAHANFIEAVKAIPGPVVNVTTPAVTVEPAIAPPVNVTVPITMPRKGVERTIVTKHDAEGRILEFERSEIEE
jgi:HK97 family phage portal protein